MFKFIALINTCLILTAKSFAQIPPLCLPGACSDGDPCTLDSCYLTNPLEPVPIYVCVHYNTCPRYWYRDADGDGYYHDIFFGINPPQGVGWSTSQGSGSGDCDDDPEKCGSGCYPGAPEICDEYDNDCDGNINETSQRTNSSEKIIPVVVHVLWNNPEQNISDAIIKSQIDVLNEDFTNNNTNIIDTYGPFVGFIGNPEIKFKLADRDEFGNPSNGIVRIKTAVKSFGINNMDFQYTLRGGHDPWPEEKYMNIWIGNFLEEIAEKNCDARALGITSYLPGFEYLIPNHDRDGIGIHYERFGRTQPLNDPFNLGKICTHEIGHYLGLLHIFGRSGSPKSGDCTDDDGIDDTPEQKGANFGCLASFPILTGPGASCNNTGGVPGGEFGAMSQNFMDYGHDRCKTFFTIQQSERMNFVLDGERKSLTIGCDDQNKCTAEIFTRDNLTVCPGWPINVKLMANTGTAYEWSNGKKEQTITVTEPGTYYVKVKNGECESRSRNITVGVQEICRPPNGLCTQRLGNSNKAILKWTAFRCQSLYEIEYGNIANTIIVELGGSRDLYVLNDLEKTKKYMWRIRSKCNAPLNYSEWSEWVEFRISDLDINNQPQNKQLVDITENQNTIFDVIVFPNPSGYQFNLLINNSIENIFQLKVYDVNGRLIETKSNLTPGKTIRFGEALKAGTYIVEVFNNAEREIIKIVKLE